jgi:hypothetical protein
MIEAEVRTRKDGKKGKGKGKENNMPVPGCFPFLF